MEMRADHAIRTISPKAVQRAFSIPQSEVFSYMDSAVMSLHVALDQWKYNDGPLEEVSMCVDAITALWSAIEHKERNGND